MYAFRNQLRDVMRHDRYVAVDKCLLVLHVYGSVWSMASLIRFAEDSNLIYWVQYVAGGSGNA